ncbi:MAG: hypothetical protein ACLP1Y_04305 [Candidatus Acidiferrales bacterium]
MNEKKLKGKWEISGRAPYELFSTLATEVIIYLGSDWISFIDANGESVFTNQATVLRSVK